MMLFGSKIGRCYADPSWSSARVRPSKKSRQSCYDMKSVFLFALNFLPAIIVATGIIRVGSTSAVASSSDMSRQQQDKESSTADAYDVFQKVDALVSKPVSGSTQALHWQTFRQDKLKSTTSAAPMAPLSKSQRASGFASWKDEQAHEATLRLQRNEAPLHQGYTTFDKSHQDQQDQQLTAKQRKRILAKIRPEDKDYFIPAATFQGAKFDYIFTTRPDRGTGYFWDGSDSVKRLQQPTTTDNTGTTKIETITASQQETTAGQSEKRAEPPTSDKGNEVDEKPRAKKKKKQAPTIIETNNHPLEQVAALLQSRQQQSALPPGWEQATDMSTQQPYYFNPATVERSWERPQLQAAPKSDAAGSKWNAATDATTGKTYYYNAAGETRWDDPNARPQP